MKEPNRRHREQALKRRLRQYQFDDDIIDAYRGDTAALCEYLRLDLPLSEEQREKLADLIYRRIQRKRRGERGPSAPFASQAQEGERQIAYLVQKLVKQRYGGKTPKGKREAALQEVIERLDADDWFADYGGKIKIENIRAILNRGAKTKPRL